MIGPHSLYCNLSYWTCGLSPGGPHGALRGLSMAHYNFAPTKISCRRPWENMINNRPTLFIVFSKLLFLCKMHVTEYVTKSLGLRFTSSFLLHGYYGYETNRILNPRNAGVSVFPGSRKLPYNWRL